MKTISFVRHAKASSDAKYKRDFDREINERGIEKTNFLTQIIKLKQIKPELIICSPSIRTTQTAQLIIQTLNWTKTQIIYDELLYSGNYQNYLNAIYSIDDQINSVMIIGHNPSISEAAFELYNKAEIMKTSQICHFEIETKKWSEISKSQIKSWFTINPKSSESAHE